MNQTTSKLQLKGERVVISATEAIETVRSIFLSIGCTEETAQLVAEPLTDSSLSGVESHGLMRTLQYVQQFEEGCG